MTLTQQLQSGDYRGLIKPGLWLLIALLILSVVKTLVSDVRTYRDQPVIEAPQRLQNRQPQAPSISMQQVAQWNLLGNAAKAPAAPKPAEQLDNLPKTTLQLDLHGTFASSTPENASALIAQRNQPAKLYSVGAQLPGGAQIHAVFPTSVIIRRNGNLETLTFKNISKDEKQAHLQPLQANQGAYPETSMPEAYRTLRAERRAGKDKFIQQQLQQ